MAVSGSEKTRIGASIAGVGKRLSILPKDPSEGVSFIPFPRPRGVRAGMTMKNGGKQ